MYCKFCGKEIADDSIFCQYCGKSLVFKKTGSSAKKYWNNMEILRNKKFLIVLVFVFVFVANFFIARNNTVYGKWYHIEEGHISELNIHINGTWELISYYSEGDNYYSNGKWRKVEKHIYLYEYDDDNVLLIKRGLLKSFLKWTGNYGGGEYYERHLFRPTFK